MARPTWTIFWGRPMDTLRMAPPVKGVEQGRSPRPSPRPWQVASNPRARRPLGLIAADRGELFFGARPGLPGRGRALAESLRGRGIGGLFLAPSRRRPRIQPLAPKVSVGLLARPASETDPGSQALLDATEFLESVRPRRTQSSATRGARRTGPGTSFRNRASVDL